MNWNWENFHDSDHLWPRHQPLGRAPHKLPRLIGAYDLEDDGDFTLLELFVERRWHALGLEEWYPYQPRGWSQHGFALADFYLSEDGQELTGSFLHSPPNDPVTRSLLLFHSSEWQGQLLLRNTSKLISVRETEPLPERLRRLIWIEW